MKRRAFSLREQSYVQELTRRLCRQAGLTGRYAEAADWAGIGWECFLEVYHRDPKQFLGTGTQGWYAARDAILDRLYAEKDLLLRTSFRQWSLDAPISDEIEEPRTELLPFSVGDCVNTVCLFDYLDRLHPLAPDAALLARCLMQGDTESEIRQFYRWSGDRYLCAFTVLRSAMEEYEKI